MGIGRYADYYPSRYWRSLRTLSQTSATYKINSRLPAVWRVLLRACCCIGYGTGPGACLHRRPPHCNWDPAAVVVIALHLGLHQAIVLAAFASLILSTASDQGPLARVLASPLLLLLGTLSYSLYMTHWIVYRLYWMYGSYLFADLASDYSQINVYLLKVFLLLALTFGLSWLTYHKIELPARRYLNHWNARA